MANLRLSDIQSKMAASQAAASPFPPGRLSLPAKKPPEVNAEPDDPAAAQATAKPEPCAPEPQPVAPEPHKTSLVEMWGTVRLARTRPIASLKPGQAYWGTADIELPLLGGLIINEIPVHYGTTVPAIQFPARPVLDVNGTRIIGENGKFRYTRLLALSDLAALAAFKDAVRAELLKHHPELAGPPPSAPAEPEPSPAAAAELAVGEARRRAEWMREQVYFWPHAPQSRSQPEP
jgi:hypothetical protein